MRIPEDVRDRAIGMPRAAALELRSLAQGERREHEEQRRRHPDEEGRTPRRGAGLRTRRELLDEPERKQEAHTLHETLHAEEAVALDVARGQLRPERAVGHHIQGVEGVEGDHGAGHPRGERTPLERRGRRRRGASRGGGAA